METTHGKTHSENGEGECWWSRIASPCLLFKTFLQLFFFRK
jgi:hypothetical protein